MKNTLLSIAFIAFAMVSFNASAEDTSKDGASAKDTSKDGASAADTSEDGAVTCSKCKTVWVKVRSGSPNRKGGHITTYRNAKKMECADCESAIVTFFKTGKLDHECKKCGGERYHCKEHKS